MTVFVNSNGATPVSITGVTTFFRNCYLFGFKGFQAGGIPINNTGTVFVGNSGQCHIPVPTGGSFWFQLSISTNQEKENLANWYVAGGVGDGVLIYYN